MSDDVELEEVVALRKCRAELERLQSDYDVLDAHHHKYATWAAREWQRSENRGDTYRKRALALVSRLLVLKPTHREQGEDFNDIMGKIWGAMYPDDPNSWQYPGQVFRHVDAVVRELAAEHDAASLWEDRCDSLGLEREALLGLLQKLIDGHHIRAGSGWILLEIDAFLAAAGPAWMSRDETTGEKNV